MVVCLVCFILSIIYARFLFCYPVRWSDINVTKVEISNFCLLSTLICFYEKYFREWDLAMMLFIYFEYTAEIIMLPVKCFLHFLLDYKTHKHLDHVVIPLWAQLKMSPIIITPYCLNIPYIPLFFRHFVRLSYLLTFFVVMQFFFVVVILR